MSSPTIRHILATLMALGASSTVAMAAPMAGSCAVFPADNIWNTPVDSLPVDPKSADYVSSIGGSETLKADFGSGEYEGSTIGIPYVTVPANQPDVPIVFAGFGNEPEPYTDESDAGPFPIPADAPVEGGLKSEGDRHVIVVQEGTCILFELYKAVPNADGSWNAVGSARFDLKSNDLRTEGWTSTDAAGLPIFPGLVRYDEIKTGEITHALRFTAPRTRQEFVWPARHYASSDDDPALPPMGQRFRLKASVDITRFSRTNQVILRALQVYGMILADNGSAWFISGAPDKRWSNDQLQSELPRLTGDDFEAVDATVFLQDNSSGVAGK
ncbi:MAG: hypothetical protein ABIQ30_13420 [Devosia sp.]